MGKSHAPCPFTALFRQYLATVSRALSQTSTRFVRERQMGPRQVLLTMQAAHFAGSQEGGQSWEDALASVADSLGNDTSWGRRFAVSRQAFHRAVNKVGAEHQAQFWEMCRSLFPAAQPSLLSELHGIRFAHLDGTQVRVPRSAELVKVVGAQTNGTLSASHYPSGKCVLLLEAGTQRVLGYELCRCKAFAEESEPLLAREERAAWRMMRKESTEKHAIIADCGFASYEDFFDLKAQGRHFLIAVPKSWNLVRLFRSRRQSDAIVEMDMPSDPTRHLKVRVFTIKDGDGKTRFIATSLTHPFTLSECRRLYKTRWGIETWFRYAKQFLALRTLRSQTLHGVRLEFLAILSVMQAIAALRTPIARHLNHITDLLSSLDHGYRKTRFRQTLAVVWNLICAALTTPLRDRPPPQFQRLLRTTVAYSPGRRFPRISNDPAGVFIPKRPSQSQRKAAKRQRLTG
jgi:Transposase DDE domain